jgi:hypothetical protein
MRPILVCAFILAGCAAPPHEYTTEAVAEQKQRALAQRDKQKEVDNRALRLAVRQLYVEDHQDMSSEIRKAILKEQLKVGMTPQQVVAAYSLWEYTTEPSVAKYKEPGSLALWTLLDRRQTTAEVGHEQWVLMRQRDTRDLYFDKGALTGWKD